MTIHGENPFLEPEGARDAVRRFRSRLGGTVSLWTTGADAERAGLTVSSLMAAGGEPGRLLALVDPVSDFRERLEESRTAVVQLLRWQDRDLADVFAGTAPAPGGMFTAGSWAQTPWGPLLEDATTWAGVRLESVTTTGWSDLVVVTVEELVIGEEPEPLVHRRGRYLRPTE